MNSRFIVSLGAVAMVFCVSLLLLCIDSESLINQYIAGKHVGTIALIYIGVLFFSTVFAPLASLPLVPIVASALGPFLTAILSILGWTLGAIVAFLIARYAGKPLVLRIINVHRLESFERLTSASPRIGYLIILRIIIPVDILSYALGLFTSVSLGTYVVTTLIGVSFFSFIFAYMGYAASRGSLDHVIALSVISITILGLGAWYVIQKGRISH